MLQEVRLGIGERVGVERLRKYKSEIATFAIVLPILGAVSGAALVLIDHDALSKFDSQPTSDSKKLEDLAYVDARTGTLKYIRPDWTDEENEAFRILTDGSEDSPYNYDCMVNPIGSGVFIWDNSPPRPKWKESYKNFCWIVVDGVVFSLNRGSELVHRSSGQPNVPDDFPEIWASTNLPTSFRIKEIGYGAIQSRLNSLK